MDSESEDNFKELIKVKYLKMKELIDFKVKSDPATEPYKSKYEAREILQEMEKLLQEKKIDTDLNVTESAMLAAVYTILGTVSMDVEEPTVGENYLQQSLTILEKDPNNPYFVLSMLCTLNQIALLYSLRQDDEKALTYLKKAESLYKEYQELSTVDPVGYRSLFTNESSETENREMFEKTHTLTLYYMAQVFKGLGSIVESALYCHWTLKRQLETKDYDKVDWALNAASLSQYLTEKNAFKEARHHLACASAMLSLRKKELDEFPDKTEEDEARFEQYKHRKSDVYRCWIKYCLNLLSRSKERLMNSADDSNSSSTVKPPPDVLCNLSFPSMDVETQENMVTYEYILTYEDAKPVFLFAQSCCNKAIEYYTLNEHASDYVVIIQDSSQLHNYLAFFEEDENKQCKLHKKRKDMLKKTVSELNENYYLDVCRELWLELGIVCSSIAEVKVAKLQKGPSPQAVEKLNQVTQESILFLGKFINSFNDKKTSKPPEAYPKEFERDILMAHMYSAQMHSKLMNPDKKKLIEFTAQSLSYYQFIVEYCKKCKKVPEDFEAELGICKDMVSLLPIKMNKLACQI